MFSYSSHLRRNESPFHESAHSILILISNFHMTPPTQDLQRNWGLSVLTTCWRGCVCVRACRWMRRWPCCRLTRRRRTLRNQWAALLFLLFNHTHGALMRARFVLINMYTHTQWHKSTDTVCKCIDKQLCFSSLFQNNSPCTQLLHQDWDKEKINTELNIEEKKTKQWKKRKNKK